MILIEKLVILILFCSFIGTLTLIVHKLLHFQINKDNAERDLKAALSSSGSDEKKRLQDVLLLHDATLSNKTKQKIQNRIDDLIIEEDYLIDHKKEYR